MEADYGEFAQSWVKDLIESLDAYLDEETRDKVMESCGRACARRGPARMAQEHRGDLDGWLTVMVSLHGGEEYVRRDGNIVHLVCPECFCDLVKDGPALLSDTYCNCTRGWMKEVFEAVVEGPVHVDVVETIKRGAQRCTFTITV